MFCPLHILPILHGKNDGECVTCKRLGLTVIQCEIDKISRTIDTMIEQGYVVDFRQSHAVVVLTRDRSELN